MFIPKVISHYADESNVNEVNGKSACNSFRGGRMSHKGELSSNLFFNRQVDQVDCPKCMKTEMYQKAYIKWVVNRLTNGK